MKVHEVQKGEGKTLTLVFDGWGVSPELFDSVSFPSDTDVWVLHDYCDLEMPPVPESFAEVHVVAWSLGVWVATFLRHSLGNVTSSVAICGTPFPVHQDWGIPPAIFLGTLNNVTADGLRRFDRRMCRDKAVLERYRELSSVSIARKEDELAFLYKKIVSSDFEPEEVSGFWQKAVIAMSDCIFPVANQQAYWQGRAEVIETDAPHLPFFDPIFQDVSWAR